MVGSPLSGGIRSPSQRETKGRFSKRMEFSQKKLPPEAASFLRNTPIGDVSPYELMLAPVYVFLKRNAKFVSVKAPLDFFTKEDLEKLGPYESFFFTPFVDRSIPFAAAGRRIRALLKLEELPPPYEVSDAVLRLMGPLWSTLGDDEVSLGVEPFFVAVLVNETCEPLRPEVLLQARDEHIDSYEWALLRSSWCVFMALHLGYCDLAYLSALREEAFMRSVSGDLQKTLQNEREQLLRTMLETFDSPDIRVLTTVILDGRSDRVSQKFISRLGRVREELVNPATPLPTVFGEGGLLDV